LFQPFLFLEILDIIMKTKSLTWLFLLLAGLFAGCQKQESHTNNADIEIRDPEISDVGAGAKQLDFTVVVTQLGTTYEQEFEFRISPFNSQSTLIGSYKTSLPTAREFVKFSVTVPGPGDYWVEVNIGPDGSRFGYGKLLKVP